MNLKTAFPTFEETFFRHGPELWIRCSAIEVEGLTCRCGRPAVGGIRHSPVAKIEPYCDGSDGPSCNRRKVTR